MESRCPQHRRVSRGGSRDKRTRMGGGQIRARRSALLIKQARACAGCGCPVGDDAIIDHVVPLGDGGADRWENLQLLCRPCHAVKTKEEATARARRKREQ